MLQSHRDPSRARQSPVVAPWSAGLYRGLTPGFARVYCGRPGSAGVHPGGRLYRALPCWRRDLPCLRRGVSLSLPLCRFSAGVYRVDCGLGHGLGRDNHLLARYFLFFSSFRPFLGVTLALVGIFSFFFSSFSLDFRRC